MRIDERACLTAFLCFAEAIAPKLTEFALLARTVTIKVRFANFIIVTRRHSAAAPACRYSTARRPARVAFAYSFTGTLSGAPLS